MILICDSGSTKADWLLMDGKKAVASFHTPGLNPVNLSEKSLTAILTAEKKIRGATKALTELHFFGSGCGNAEGRARMMRVLKKVFPGLKITVDNDLMASAIATCGNDKVRQRTDSTGRGVVAILGTGSNCCYFDGKKIHVKNFGLGFMLGDEGSGTWFGRKFLVAFLYGQMPASLAKKFYAEYKVDRQKAIASVYNKPNPNIFLSSFMPFIIANRKNSFVKKFLLEGVEYFFDTTILAFPEAKKSAVHFTGSIASLLEKEIRKVGKKKNIRIGNIFKQPMDGLQSYYSTRDVARYRK
jgi:N-acetylglucosamine kinase-like BadF-type ATPase